MGLGIHSTDIYICELGDVGSPRDDYERLYLARRNGVGRNRERHVKVAACCGQLDDDVDGMIRGVAIKNVEIEFVIFAVAGCDCTIAYYSRAIIVDVGGGRGGE